MKSTGCKWYLDVVNDEINGYFVFAPSRHDDVGVDHGRSDEDIEGRLYVTVVLLQHTLENN